MTFKNIVNKQCSCFVLKLQSVTIFLTNILKWLLKKIYKNVALFKGTEYCYIFDISRKWHEKYNLQKCLKIRYKKNIKTWRDQDRLINHGDLVPLSETGVRENWKTLLTLQSPREARHQKTAGSQGLELVMSMSRSRWSHQPRVSKLAEPGSRHDLSFFESFGRNQPDRKITILCKREKIEWSESYFKIDNTLHRLRFIFLSFFSVIFSSSF